MIHNDWLSELFQLERPAKPDSIADWFKGYIDTCQGVESSTQRAALVGRQARCVGHAFAAGYQSAMECMFEDFMPKHALASFCVSESQGNHPRAISCTLRELSSDHYTVKGEKSFVSGALDAQHLMVACKSGNDEHGRPVLKVLSLPADLPQIEVHPLAELPFVPEVSHGRLTLNDQNIDSKHILPGDGYLNYIKPFRTCEDLHVMTAISAYLLGESIESGWDEQLTESLLSLTLSFTAMDRLGLESPAGHLAMSGFRVQLMGLVAASEQAMQASSTEVYEAWIRDKALLGIAQKTQLIRKQNAWEYFRA